MKTAQFITALILGCCLSGPAAAQPRDSDPYAYSLRMALFPVHFQGGISQSHLGSGGRVEVDIMPGLTVATQGRGAWASVIGQKGALPYNVRGGISIHLVDKTLRQPLSGTVYPADVPTTEGAYTGHPSEADVPIHKTLGGPRLQPPEHATALLAPMRELITLRVGYDYTRAVERTSGVSVDGDPVRFLNTFHAGYAGLGWGTHWNLEPNLAAGKREVGYKHYYIDATFTAKPLDEVENLTMGANDKRDFFPLGLRIGLEGAMDGFWDSAPGVGLAYNLELGALPGRSGLEGYLFIGLGVELDVILQPPPAPSPSQLPSK
jgi:hypothetical protein